MKEIMVRAWEIAEEAVKQHGGRKIEYISGALKMAWAEHKQAPEHYFINHDLEQSFDFDSGVIFTTGSKRQPVWMAEISGLHPQYHFERDFLQSNTNDNNFEYDLVYLKENTVYNFCTSALRNDQYFFIIVDGNVIELNKDQVKDLVK